jgi:hypothetical protein
VVWRGEVVRMTLIRRQIVTVGSRKARESDGVEMVQNKSLISIKIAMRDDDRDGLIKWSTARVQMAKN